MTIVKSDAIIWAKTIIVHAYLTTTTITVNIFTVQATYAPPLSDPHPHPPPGWSAPAHCSIHRDRDIQRSRSR